VRYSKLAGLTSDGVAVIPIPSASPESEPQASEVRAAIEDRGVCRLAELRDDLDGNRLGPPLLELIEDGQVAVFPVGDTVQVKPVR
jgi:hypothetical protein